MYLKTKGITFAENRTASLPRVQVEKAIQRVAGNVEELHPEDAHGMPSGTALPARAVSAHVAIALVTGPASS